MTKKLCKVPPACYQMTPLAGFPEGSGGRIRPFLYRHHSTMILHAHITWGMNNGHVGGSSSETYSPHPHDDDDDHHHTRTYGAFL
jgi:hypothetical protein